MRNTLRLLVLLTVLAQGLLVLDSADLLRGELPQIHGPEDLLLLVSPAILGFGGAAAAGWLHRRGSAWAWVVAGVPLIVLGLALLLALVLWFNPITHRP